MKKFFRSGCDIANSDPLVVGIYNPAFDKTRRKIAERRMLTLREVGERTAAARDLKGFWSQVIKGLEFNGMISYGFHFQILTGCRIRCAIHASVFRPFRRWPMRP
jgi:hypothetical protein